MNPVWMRLAMSGGASGRGAEDVGGSAVADTGTTALPALLQERAQRSIQPGFDFGEVRIRRDDAEAARHNAVAFTSGADVVLGAGVGPLGAPAGMRLLGHELAHVVQQSRGGATTTSPRAGNPLERSADVAADAFVSGRPGRVEGAARAGIARTPRSLGQTLTPGQLSDAALEAEIREIHAWVMANPGSSSEREILDGALANLEDEVRRRQAASAPAGAHKPAAAPAAAGGCPTGMCHQPAQPASRSLLPSMIPSAAPTPDEIDAIRSWIAGGAGKSRAPAADPGAASPPPAAPPVPKSATPPRWVPIIQHMHLGTFGDTTIIWTSPSQGAVQLAPDPSAGYNFDTYVSNPKTGALIPAQHMGGTRYRVFMGTPECPGCHFGHGLEVDILGENPLLVFGPSLVMTATGLIGARFGPAPMGPSAARPWTPRVIQGGRGAGLPPPVVEAPVGAPSPQFIGNTPLKLQPTVGLAPTPAVAPTPGLRLVPDLAPAPMLPPAVQPNPLIPVFPALGSAGAPVSASATGQAAPVMPQGLSKADQELWKACSDQHDIYKATQAEAAGFAAVMNAIAVKLAQNQATPQERLDFCRMLDERIKIVQRLHKERQRYVSMDCDKFDWFNSGTTKAQREAQHQIEIDNVSAQISNFFDLRKRYCS